MEKDVHYAQQATAFSLPPPPPPPHLPPSVPPPPPPFALPHPATVNAIGLVAGDHDEANYDNTYDDDLTSKHYDIFDSWGDNSYDRFLSHSGHGDGGGDGAREAEGGGGPIAVEKSGQGDGARETEGGGGPIFVNGVKQPQSYGIPGPVLRCVKIPRQCTGLAKGGSRCKRKQDGDYCHNHAST